MHSPRNSLTNTLNMAEQLSKKEDKREASPLTLENVFEAVKRVRNWRELGDWLLGPGIKARAKLDAMQRQFDSDEARLRAVLEAFLRGEGLYQPTWRRVIHALYCANENTVARDILTYAEAVEDPTMTVENVTKVLNKIEGDKWRVMEAVGLDISRPLVEEIKRRYSTDADQIHACIDYYVNYRHKASWQHLTLGLYCTNELAAARESKSFMSTDPTLCVTAKVEPNQRQQVWKSMMVIDYIIDEIQKKHSTDLDRETATIDTYISCHPRSSWEHLASVLYQHQQVAAVEEVRSYLPPRDLTITVEKLKQLFEPLVDPENVDSLGRLLDLPRSDRSKIQTNYHIPTQRKEAYLDQYVHYHPCPSWRDVANNLNRFSLDEQADLVMDTYVKVSEKTQQCFDAAMMEGEVWMRNVSTLLLGPGGSGKSHMLAILLEEDPPSLRESTPCAKKPVRTVAHCKVGVSNDHFVRITDDHYSDMLAATAEHLTDSSNSATTEPTGTVQQKGEESSNVASSSSSTEKKSSNHKSPRAKIDALGREKTWCVRRAMKREHLRRIQERSKKTSDLNNKDIVDFNDTGGQSMFHEILPVFIRNTMFGILTVKLNESLDGYPLVEYYTKGNRVGEPFDSPFTHLETIRHCMRVIRSTCDRETCPKIAFVGTHKDREKECPDENREMKEKKLKSMIPPKIEDNIITFGGSLLLPIDAKSPQKEDKASMSILREKLMNELQKRKPEKIPLRYVPLEMAFQRLAKDQRKSVLSKEECFEVAATFNFTRESFEAALRYLHGLKLIFYYEEVLPDMVFIDAQALLDKITELVVHSLSLHGKSTGRLLGAQKKFKQCGIVTMDILSEFDSHYVPNVFTRKELILLFKYLRIMAEVREGEYLMPCVLKKEDLPRPLSSIPSLDVSPLLFYFDPDGPQLGVYCFLITTLISEANWKLMEIDSYPVQVSRNRVQFALPGNNPGCVTITDSFSTFFHVDFEPPKGVSGERIHEICERECPTIRETILTAIRKASQKLNYYNSIPEVAFPCRCMNGEATLESLHPALISNTGLLVCTNNVGICSEMTKQHHIWDCYSPGHVTSPELPAATPRAEVINTTTQAQDGTNFSTASLCSSQPETNDLGISDLGDVLEAVWEARVRWYNIGLKLGTPPGTLDSIGKTANQNVDDCITAVIKDWLNNGKPRPTWAAVAKALRSPMVGYRQLAEQLPPHPT